jgi:hypothetical protein
MTMNAIDHADPITITPSEFDSRISHHTCDGYFVASSVCGYLLAITIGDATPELVDCDTPVCVESK